MSDQFDWGANLGVTAGTTTEPPERGAEKAHDRARSKTGRLGQKSDDRANNCNPTLGANLGVTEGTTTKPPEWGGRDSTRSCTQQHEEVRPKK